MRGHQEVATALQQVRGPAAPPPPATRGVAPLLPLRCLQEPTTEHTATPIPPTHTQMPLHAPAMCLGKSELSLLEKQQQGEGMCFSTTILWPVQSGEALAWDAWLWSTLTMWTEPGRHWTCKGNADTHYINRHGLGRQKWPSHHGSLSEGQLGCFMPSQL